MYSDEFKSRYQTIPFATFVRNHKKGTLDSDFSTLPHMHKEFEVLVITAGYATFNIGCTSYDIHSGDIVIIPPYSIHSAKIYKDFDFCHFCLCFDLSITGEEKLMEKLEKGYLTPYPIVSGNEKCSREIRECLKSAYNSHKSTRVSRELLIKGQLCIFLGLLIENNLFISEKKVAKESVFVYKAMDVISKNYKNQITSFDMAKIFFISESYFCNIFKKNFGYTFQKYLCIYRIEKANLMLKTTEQRISSIALENGFNSFSFFCKMFKEFVGITPSEYKKSPTDANHNIL